MKQPTGIKFEPTGSPNPFELVGYYYGELVYNYDHIDKASFLHVDRGAMVPPPPPPPKACKYCGRVNCGCGGKDE